MKRQELLCLLALLLLFTGFILTGSYSRSGSPAAEGLPCCATYSVLSAQPLTIPHVAVNVSGLSETSPVAQHQPTFLPKDLSIHHLMEVESPNGLFPINQNARRHANALLRAIIARTLGLSSLMLRE